MQTMDPPVKTKGLDAAAAAVEGAGAIQVVALPRCGQQGTRDRTVVAVEPRPAGHPSAVRKVPWHARIVR